MFNTGVKWICITTFVVYLSSVIAICITSVIHSQAHPSLSCYLWSLPSWQVTWLLQIPRLWPVTGDQCDHLVTKYSLTTVFPWHWHVSCHTDPDNMSGCQMSQVCPLHKPENGQLEDCYINLQWLQLSENDERHLDNAQGETCHF